MTISHIIETKLIPKKMCRNSGMVHFAEINQVPPSYSMMKHIERVATPKLSPRNCLRYLETTLNIGGRVVGLTIYVRYCSSKSDFDKLDIDKLETGPVNLSKLNDVVENGRILLTLYDFKILRLSWKILMIT